MSFQPQARYAALSGYGALSDAVGLDWAPLMRSAGLDPAGLADQDRWIPAAAVARLLEISAAASGRDDFGLRLAEFRRLANLGPLALVIREEPDVRSVLEMLIRYEHAYNQAISIRLSEADGPRTALHPRYPPARGGRRIDALRSHVGRCGVSAEIEAVQFAAPGASLGNLGDGEGDRQAHLQALRDAEATPEPAAGPAGDFELEARAGQAKGTASDRRSGLWLCHRSGWPLSAGVRLWRPTDVRQRSDRGRLHAYVAWSWPRS